MVNLMKKLKKIIAAMEVWVFAFIFGGVPVLAEGTKTSDSTSEMIESMMTDTGLFDGVKSIWVSIIGSSWGLMMFVVIGVALVYGGFSIIGLIRGKQYREMAKDNLLWIVLAVFGIALFGKVMAAILGAAASV